MKEYKIKQYKGINDLLNTCPYVGEWNDYAFKDVDENDKEAINAEVLKRKDFNDRYIQLLKDDGFYGKEYEISITMETDSRFDDNEYPKGMKLENYRMEFIDINK